MTQARARRRLNLGLALTAVVCAVVVGAAAFWTTPWEGSETSGSGGDLSGRAGVSVGPGTISAVRTSEEEVQERTAAQLEAATKMVTAFNNLNHEDVDATLDAVRSMSTGDFLEQFNAGAKGLQKGLRQAESTLRSEVVWAGLVAGDEDSATVILAVEGVVANRATEFEQQARQYRIQVELLLEDGRWLTNDLQYVSMV
ncbi:hypothetical protein KUV85_04120 [Nocardioides panacisoli]|uniref:hypothetical protein n=1 Tax=Nocardioides panacisoli TaxID=627624 RepID=UPI001C629070|nr:hypothetical protein [Nocardioides panacisoli]QYJ04881.1 hypothetical protein KUV85_04120 [Nocardioides panacisoli]